MVPSRPTDTPHSGFVQPVPIPSQNVGDDLRYFLGVNGEWIPVMLGALSQLLPFWVWQSTDPTAIAAVQCNVQELLYMLATAPSSPEFPIQFEILADGTLQYSLDQGFSWADTGFQFGSPPGDFPWPVTPNALHSGAPFTYIWAETGGALVTFD